MNEESYLNFGTRRKGRTRNLWMQKVTTGMRDKGINNVEWIDSEK